MLGPVQRLVAAGHQAAGLLLGHRVGHRQADAQGQAAFRADGVGDAEAGALRIGGSFRADNATAFVRLLEQGFPVRAEDRGERIVLRSR